MLQGLITTTILVSFVSAIRYPVLPTAEGVPLLHLTSSPIGTNILKRQESPCPPAAPIICSDVCCAVGDVCCPTGCTPAGSTCCGDGYCAQGYGCCPSLFCAPAATDCCSNASYCNIGYFCCTTGCAPEGWLCCGDGTICNPAIYGDDCCD
jgi:hypothetical protein